MSNTLQNNSGSFDKHLNTFYTPSFGEEEFNITSLNQQHQNIVQNQIISGGIGHNQQQQYHQAVITKNQSSMDQYHHHHHHQQQQQQQQQHLHHQMAPQPMHSMGEIIDENQYHLWNQDSSPMYMTQHEFGMQQQQTAVTSNQQQNMYYNEQTIGSPQQHHQQQHHHQQQQQQQHHQQLHHHQQQQQQQQHHHNQMMMPPPQKSPQITSPMGFVGHSPHAYGGGGGGGSGDTGTSDDSDDSGLRANGLKRPSPEPICDKMGSPNSIKSMKQTGSSPPASLSPSSVTGGGSAVGNVAIKKPKVQRKKKKKDPNEPQKPVSAYALFFRDTQAAIKNSNPNASFGEVSTIVASMWDQLEPEHKDVYKKKTEAAKIEYLKTLAAYRANVVSKGNDLESASSPGQQVLSPAAVAPPLPLAAQSPQNNIGMQQSQMSPPPQQQQNPVQGHGTMQRVSPQHNQFVQQQPTQQPPIHNSYPSYAGAYKSPTHHQHDYSGQVHLQQSNNVAQQQQLQQHQQMGINQMTHNQQQNMNYSYEQQQQQQQPNHQSPHAATNVVNGMINIDNSNPYHQQQQQHHHINAHQHSTLSAQHNQNSIVNSNNNEHAVQHHHHNQQQQQHIVDMQQQQQHQTNNGISSGPTTNQPQQSNNYHQQQQQPNHKCIRNGCTNQAIISPDWEDEYCSNECVITHCGDVFGNWVHKNGQQQQQTYSAVK